MNNKFRKISLQVLEVSQARDAEPIDLRLDEGIILNQAPQDISPRGSPNLDFVRIEQGALKGDWGIVALGNGAPSTILAQGQHRFIQASTGELIEVHFRLYRTIDGFPQIDSYDEDTDTWVAEATGDFEINEVFLSWISYFDAVYFADGDRVFRWNRSELEEDSGVDFNAGNLLTSEGASAVATVTPIASDNAYRAHYSLTVIGQTSEEHTVTVAVKYEGIEIASRTHTIPVDDGSEGNGWTGSIFGLRTYVIAEATIDFSADITDSTDVLLVLKETDLESEEIDLSLFPASGFDEWDGFRLSFVPAVDDKYYFRLFHDGTMASTVDAEFFYQINGGGWVSVGTQLNLVAGDTELEFEETITALATEAGSLVEFRITISDPAPTSLLDNINSANVRWNATPDVQVHGFNEGTDSDPSPGITYNTTGDPQNIIELVYEDELNPVDVLVGRYLGLGTFANRFVLLRKDGDLQKAAICVSGNPLDWIGEGSDETLLESRSDPVDELMGFVPLTANTGALFRKKSIMRVVQTGNSALPLAYYPWIENVGTESPFSLAIVPGGVCFFGYDKHAYFLAEGMQQPLALDEHVHEEWEMIVPDSELEFVEGWYDPVSSEYNLILPEEE